ncbi:C2H2 type zinc-finger-domain-containing protein [Aspergillus keveii]|uniref:C2H2 type zinc-finger-domain-containing protein n=1 Tax=Aspergillus keveii TaxID=714993 RepID=A0ABR4G823_9EURO
MTIPDLTTLNTDDTTPMLAQTSSTTDTNAAPDRSPLIVAKPPSSCRLCDTELDGLQTWRAHVKSDQHVRNLQFKVAQPGSAISPQPPFSKRSHKTKRTSPSPSHAQKRNKPVINLDEDTNNDNNTEDEDEPSVALFNPQRCLFCPQISTTFDDSTTHMSAIHNFTIPFPELLAVDLETVLSYLHALIFDYRECITCSTQRSTVDAVQQHMASKGHCRLDITAETEEFYNIPQLELQSESNSQLDDEVIKQIHRDSSMPIHLSSGRIVGHRRNLDLNERRAARRGGLPDREPDLFAINSDPEAPRPGSTISRSRPGSSYAFTPSTSTDLEIASRRRANRARGGGGEIVHRSEALLAAQLSRLQVAGNRAEQKVEKRRGRLDRTSNPLLFKHFRIDAGDSRFGRAF